MSPQLQTLVLRLPLLASGLYFQNQLVDQGVHPAWAVRNLVH